MACGKKPKELFLDNARQFQKININQIEITNVKGIGNKSFQLDLSPNKPTILVAPFHEDQNNEKVI